jgi:hypothetical protein
MVDGISDEAAGVWRSCWRVVHNPGPGIFSAIPLSCTEVNNNSNRLYDSAVFNSSKAFVADGASQTVRWLGYTPGRVLMFAESDWNPRKGKPSPPHDGWRDLEDPNSSSDAAAKLARSRAKIRDTLRQSVHNFSWGSLPFPPWVKRDDTLTRSVAGKLHPEVWADFMREMPSGILDCYSQMTQINHWQNVVGYGRPDIINYLLGSSPSPGVDVLQAGIRRQQFILSHPFFSGVRDDPNIKMAVDQGDPSIPILADFLGTEERIVRQLNRVKAPFAPAVREFLRAPGGLRMLEGMPPSWLPSLDDLSLEGWASLTTLAFSQEVGGDKASSQGFNMGSEVKPAAARKIGAHRIATYLGSSLAPDAKGGLEWLCEFRGWHHLDDAARGLAQELFLPAIARVNPRATLSRSYIKAARYALLCLGARKLRKTLQQHLDGGIHGARMGRPLVGVASSEGWGQAAPDAECGNGKVLRFLKSQPELDEEGRAMSHCVGTYGESCSRRECGILSIGVWKANGDQRWWMPTSTVEIGMQDWGDVLAPVVMQHFGPSNGSPPQEDGDAIAWWLAEVSKGSIVMEPGSILRSVRGNYRANDLPVLLGEAWRTPEAHAYRWDRWRRLLGTRSASFGDWLLTLPKVYLEAFPAHEEIVAAVVDMDAEMAIAAEISDAGLDLERPNLDPPMR